MDDPTSRRTSELSSSASGGDPSGRHTLDEITSQGAGFLTSLHAGDAVTVLQDGKAVALLIGVKTGGLASRPLGCYAGQIQVSTDFNDPLPQFDQAIDAPSIVSGTRSTSTV